MNTFPIAQEIIHHFQPLTNAEQIGLRCWCGAEAWMSEEEMQGSKRKEWVEVHSVCPPPTRSEIAWYGEEENSAEKDAQQVTSTPTETHGDDIVALFHAEEEEVRQKRETDRTAESPGYPDGVSHV